MFKLGRGSGGGRGNGKRPAHPPSGRPVGAAPSRLSLPGGRGRGGAPPEPAAPVLGREETFSMVSREPLDFGAIIRLAPDLVDEIRRAEARGGPVRIKFDPNSNDTSGNVLDVDGKEFQFTWSRDSGDLCNIYEERRNGEDGNGLLVERGSAWRKLNVHRILDESIKNHVKMMSEEAERRNKSRKAIVLDPANPSVKSQSSAAVEGSMRRMHWNKKREPQFKKQRIDSSQSTFRPPTKLSSSKHRPSVSPQISPTEKPVLESLTSPFGVGNSCKNLVTFDVDNPTAKTNEDMINTEKEVNSKGGFNSLNKVVHQKNGANLKSDLRSLLVTLLSENPKGMSLKAIEKSIREEMSCSPKKIESVLKNIACFQAPGKYLLKPGAGTDSISRLLMENGSSPDPESAQEEKATMQTLNKSPIEEFEKEVDVCSFDEPGELGRILEKSNELEASPDACGNDTKLSHGSECKAGSTSESGSDSDSGSDSSDSGSDSGSQSRSPAGSGSASSSGSESDGSSSSKETDIEVNITTSDDELDEMDNKSLAAKLKSSTLPGTQNNNDDPVSQKNNIDEPIDRSGAFGDQDDNVLSPLKYLFSERNFSDVQRVAKEMPDTFVSSNNPEVDILEENIGFDSEGNCTQHNEGMPSMKFNQKHLANEHVDSFWGSTNRQNLFTGREKPNEMKDSFDHNYPQILEKTPKSRMKRPSEGSNINEKAGSIKKPRPPGYTVSGKASVSPELNIGSDKSEQNQFFDSSKVASTNIRRNSTGAKDFQESGGGVPEMRNAGINQSKKGHSPGFQNDVVLDAFESVRTVENNGKRKSFNAEKFGRHIESFDPLSRHGERLSTYSEEPNFPTSRNLLQDTCSAAKDKHHQDGQDGNLESGEKYYPSSARDGNLGGRTFHEPFYKKFSEQARNQKDDFMISNASKSESDKMVGPSGKNSILRRELSDPELGELREPTRTEFLEGSKGSMDKKGSFKLSENKINTNDDFPPDFSKRNTSDFIYEPKRQSPITENRNPDFNKRKTSSDFMYESKKQSPITEIQNRYSQEGLHRKTSDHLAKSSQRSAISQSQPSQSFEQRNLDNRLHVDRPTDPSRREETRGSLKTPATSDTIPEESSRSIEHLQQKDSGYMVEPIQKKESDPNSSSKKNDGYKRDANLSNERIEPTEEKATLFFSKFEKDEPALRGPIRDYLQYKEYVKEFQEKYQCYLSLNEIMEKTRAEFLKIGGNFPELAKGTDKKAYNDCCRRIVKFCHQNKERDNRVKKTFILLHDELKILKQRIKDFAAEYSKD